MIKSGLPRSTILSHFIHAIVAPDTTADSISIQWPELARLDLKNGFSLFPVEANLIDEKIAPDRTPSETGDEFVLLTDGFRRVLERLSIDGQLAYVETEYFGGIGGQGALVFRSGNELMPPTWDEAGTINEAFKLIGLDQGRFHDRFEAAGLTNVRDNDGFMEMIRSEATQIVNKLP